MYDTVPIKQAAPPIQSNRDWKDGIRRAPFRFAELPLTLQFLALFAAVALSHLTLLRLPYYWDEGGYYIPAALDFFHRGTLIPVFTNAHPPLPAVLMGSLWHVTGFHVVATRLFVCAVAAGALLAVFQLARRLLGATAACAVTLLTGIYPIWFAQSSLGHADIFAAAFTLAALALYLPSVVSEAGNPVGLISPPYLSVAVLFSLSVLSKETAIVQPAALAALHGVLFLRHWRRPWERRFHLLWTAALASPVLPLVAWYAYHRSRTGFMFGNPEYLRYNATANFTLAHVRNALQVRFIHLWWQRNMWVPVSLAVGCLLFPRKSKGAARTLPPAASLRIVLLIVANWILFSVLGGAPLTRYLLPCYPLLLLGCVAVWRSRTRHWPWLAAMTAAAFLSGWWLDPPTSFAPEDSLAYRDMIVVHQAGIAYIDEHYPNATVLTAWPASAELERPELGYTDRPVKVTPLDKFTAAAVDQAAMAPGRYDLALAITTHFVAPSLQRYFFRHPETVRGRKFAEERDLSPEEVAARLGGEIVFKEERYGQCAAVVRFPRRIGRENAGGRP